MKIRQVRFEPIGWVRSAEKKSRRGSFEKVVAEIVVKEDLVDALQGLEEFSHLEVIYFMHIAARDRKLKLRTRPLGLPALPEVGLFATRSPYRPNRIGLTLCELLSIERNIITMRGLDALDGSPVLDIKGPSRRGYLGCSEMRFPAWTERLDQIRARERI